MSLKVLRINEVGSEEAATGPVERETTLECPNGKILLMWKKIFHKLGHLIGQHPKYFILFPFFISILGLTGLQRFVENSDSKGLFTPIDGEIYESEQFLKKHFPINSSLFDPSRIQDNKYFAKILMSAKDGGTILRTDLWKEVVFLNDIILNITVDWQGHQYRYVDLCANWNGECFKNTIFNLNDFISDFETKKTSLSYPISIYPFVIPVFLGGVEVNEEEGTATSVKAVYTLFFLARDDADQEKRSSLWESELLKMLDSVDFEYLKVDRCSSSSLKDALDENVQITKPYSLFAILMFTVFGLFTVSSFDCVRSKFLLGVSTLVTVFLAVLCGFGVTLYMGVPFITNNGSSIFIFIICGFQYTFILLSNWRKTRIQDSVPERLGEVYQNAGPPITITFLATLATFVAAAFTTMPGYQIVSIYFAVTSSFLYVWFLCLFGGLLALSGRLESNQRHSVFCCRVSPQSELNELSDNRVYFYRLFFSGGVSKKDQWNELDNKPCSFSVFFRDQFSRATSHWTIRCLVILASLFILGGAIFGVLHTKEGLDLKSLAVDSSYVRSFYVTEDAYFRTYPHRIQVLIGGNLTYSDIETRKNLMKLRKTFHSLPNIGSSMFSENWIYGFIRFMRKRPSLLKNATNEESFIRILREKYFDSDSKEQLDVVFNEDFTRIVASRFVIQSYKTKNIDQDMELVRTLRKIASESPLDVMIYQPKFVTFDQLLEIRLMTAKIIGTVSIVSVVLMFLFTFEVLPSILTGLSVLFMEISLVGYMCLWDIRLDTLSESNLLLTIGLPLLFSVYVVYAFVSAKSNDSEENLAKCLYQIGYPICQSFLIIFAGFVVLYFVPSYIPKIYSKMVIILISIGTFQSLLLIPTVLCLTSFKSLKKRSSSVLIRNIGSSNTLTYTVTKPTGK